MLADLSRVALAGEWLAYFELKFATSESFLLTTQPCAFLS